MYLSHNVSLITTHVLQEMKNKGEKIAVLTAYDYSMAKILDESNIDVILVIENFKFLWYIYFEIL